MKQFTINIIEWKDIKKWFWDKFCFPRREIVASWLDYHNMEIRSIVEQFIVTYGKFNIDSDSDMENLSKILRSYDKKVKEITERTNELIMMK